MGSTVHLSCFLQLFYFFFILIDIFMTFGAMGAGLEFHVFSGLSRGCHELRERTSGMVMGLSQGAGLPGGTPDLRERRKTN